MVRVKSASKSRRISKNRPRRKTLSVCIIAKNEEHQLGRCLASVRQVADQIVVVDTGSTDRTVEVARSHGAEVYFFPWQDDFAAARNAALDHATGDWILSIDADEALDPSTAGNLPELLERPVVDRVVPVWSVQIGNAIDSGDVSNIYMSYGPRLFPRHPQVRWVRPIHEEPRYIGDDGSIETCATDKVALVHFGYLRDEWEAKAKGERNVELLLRATADHPEDAVYEFYLGQTYYVIGRHAESLAHFERFIAASSIPGKVSEWMGVYARAMAVGACLAAQWYERGVEIGEAAGMDHDCSDLYYNLAFCYFRTGELEKATSYFNKVRSLGEQPSGVYPTDLATTTWKSLSLLGDIASEQGKLDVACSYYFEALSSGASWETDSHLAEVLLARGHVQEAYDRLDRLVTTHPEKDAIRMQLARLLEGQNECDAALAVLAGGVKDEPTNAQLYVQLGTLLGRLGRYDDAVNALTVAVDLKPN